MFLFKIVKFAIYSLRVVVLLFIMYNQINMQFFNYFKLFY